MPFLLRFKTLKPTVVLVSLFSFGDFAVQAQSTQEAGANKCVNSAIERSSAMINVILDDLKANYSHVGGGGITEVKQTKTNVFLVSIAQEERIDQISYELSVGDDCTVVLLKKEETLHAQF